MAQEKTTPPVNAAERIVAEAAKIFWTYGIKSVTMDDLATRMGISKKTLYQHVADKNDLVEKVVDHVAREFKCGVMCISRAGNAIDELYAITNTVAERLKGIHPSIHFDLEKYHPEAFRRMMETRRREVYATTVANMERGIKEGIYRNDLNIPIIATLYISRLEVVFDGDLFPADRFNPGEVHWALFRYHVRGIASEKGVKYLVNKVKKDQTP
ncbi:MAG TPA: TetR/AcrR family transcriptional regulator [Flavobacteriales bacterium]|nr:TetR/AcrR family transcriptional regulator [Flavobacteriales bacterium]HRN38224.1 TetR/AcrR family transcriptional regulator [Flavobacteriales bacterium]HRO40182.1 TetR/AcrR family transcriptional regulator [Flavobacteriales bacterium]HRP80729.1 TetR/AcrR family transcriptional regulator [Flavobacteriales bacterium]HRQ84925.1 TetR/AcrR family transcriptional regulator [Flavobacteriales bacterium]